MSTIFEKLNIKISSIVIKFPYMFAFKFYLFVSKDSRRSLCYSLVELKNGSMAAGYENLTIIIWKDNTLKENTKLNGHEKKVKYFALFADDLLASGSCDSTIKIWNLTTTKNIKSLKEHRGCVNSLVSLEYLNKTYLISASDDLNI